MGKSLISIRLVGRLDVLGFFGSRCCNGFFDAGLRIGGRGIFFCVASATDLAFLAFGGRAIRGG